ncbi:AI-2E family transporter [Sulfitobacter sp. D35]|uniref:AI-2E family transporter n=1 Tax=Sulfitobacter sp. D35 TaxID=3083252 RepID=UPI00296F8CD9|nr:AI-2E family transporter [Sulfitobacter sp. D35]MDW4499894.1 AI-2E family transporter [Sulfitobacter sp. D35]
MIRISLAILATVVVFVTLREASEFFAPVIAAMVTGVVLSPLADGMDRLGFRPSVATFFSAGLAVVVIVAIMFFIEPYVSRAIARAPVIWTELREAVQTVRAMLLGLDEIAKDVAEAVDPDAAEDAAPTTGATDAIPKVTDALFFAPAFVAQLMIFIGAFYFFLMTRKDIYAWLGNSIEGLKNEDFITAERRVARYFLTIASINATFGLLVTGVMHAFGMPGPGFWGLMAFLLNFILYLGPIMLAGMLLVAGLVVFDGAISVAPAAAYLLMNATEGQFVTPALVGQRMAVNPLVVFLFLVFWIWMWGPLGGMVAIPMLIWMISLTEAALGQTISSGMPGKLRPNLLAGRDA